MASGLSFFSFSSPPHPTVIPWERATTTLTPFYTPQQPQSSRRDNWVVAGGFAPTSPSPLRTSRNANLMPSSPGFGGGVVGKTAVVDGNGGENVGLGLDGVLETSHAGLTPVATETPAFSFGGFTTTTAAQERATQFQFEARARSSSPSVVLQSHAKEGRDSRKRLFLNRLKSKRDDERVDRAGDQILRMDFMKERRRWVAEKEKSGWDAAAAGEEDEMMDHDVIDVEEEMSPTDEKEVEELAREYYLQQGVDGTHQTGQPVDTGFEEFSDDGYDEAFMEVLSQGSGGQDRTWNTMENIGVDGLFNDLSQRRSGGVDSEMDMS